MERQERETEEREEGEWEEPRRRRRHSTKQDQQSISENTTTFYIANIPWDCTLGLLWRTFRNHGQMTDVYLPRRRNKAGKYFAFLRFENVRNTDSLAKALSNVRLGDGRLHVNEAKFKKDERDTRRREHTVNAHENNKGKAIHHAREQRIQRVDERTWGDASHFPPLENNYGKRPVRIPDKVFPTQAVLGRVSLIGKVKDVVRLCRLEDFLKASGVEDVTLKYVVGMTVLLSFMTSGMAKTFLSDRKEEWDLWFHNLEVWNGQSLPFERIAWLKITGVPLHLWDKEVFDIIAASYGEVVHGSVASSKDGNYAMEQVAVLVKEGKRITDVVEVQWKRSRIKVWVNETDETWSPDFVKADYDTNQRLIYDMDNGKIYDTIPNDASGSSSGNDKQGDGPEEGEVNGDVRKNHEGDEPVIDLENDVPGNVPATDELTMGTNGQEGSQQSSGLDAHGERQQASGMNVHGRGGPQEMNDNNITVVGSSRKRARFDFGPNDDLIDLNSPQSGPLPHIPKTYLFGPLVKEISHLFPEG